VSTDRQIAVFCNSRTIKISIVTDRPDRPDRPPTRGWRGPADGGDQRMEERTRGWKGPERERGAKDQEEEEEKGEEEFFKEIIKFTE
jgi:hypothetical protein